MNRYGRRSSSRSFLVVFVILAVIAAGWALYAALSVGEAPTIELSADREAVGAGTRVEARFLAARDGLVGVRLEAVQGDSVAVLAEQAFQARSMWAFWNDPQTTEAALTADIGRGRPDWLREGEVTLRAVALRAAGKLRSPDPVVVEKTLPVRFRPPALAVLSSQHYVTQGGSGAVRYRVGEGGSRSGVRAGDEEFLGWPFPGGGEGEMFALFGVPWDLGDSDAIRVFAEDAAGNRVERAFVDQFKPIPPKRDSIEVSESFLERVVPDIVANSPGFDATGSLLDQYLRINGAMRAQNIATIREVAKRSKPDRLWSGSFLQMPNTKKMAGFAEQRTYLNKGRAVDQQTHLGVDLASTARASVPAAASGEIAFAEYLGIYGNAVMIDHGYGLLTIYAHLSSIDVQVGDRVERGQSLGRSGATGLAGGDHLHFGVAIQGLEVSPIEWLDAKWVSEKIDSRLP